MLNGILLDVDGTLVDSNEAHVRAYHTAFTRHGFAVPQESIRRLVGMGGDNLLPAAIGVDSHSAQGKQILHERAEWFTRVELPGIRGFPQVRALVQRLLIDGLTLAVASSGEQDEVEALLSIAGVRDLVSTYTTSADVERSKPDADVITAALHRISLPPDQVLLIGDTPYDIEAASAAGVGVIALRCGGFSDPQLAGALAIYDDPSDLLAHYEASPLANRH